MIIKAKQVLLGKQLENNKFIEIQNGKIISVSDSSGVFDFETDLLSPGFIDNHCHGFNGHDFMEVNDNAYNKILSSLITQGTTSVFATAVTQSTQEMLAMFEFASKFKTTNQQTNILGIHSEGPFLSIEKKGAQPQEYISKPDAELLQTMFGASNGFLKVMTFAPEHDANSNLVKQGAKLGIKMQIGHTMANKQEIKEAIKHGATGITHAYNAMPKSLENETTGFLAKEQEIYAEIISDGIHNTSDEVQNFVDLKGKEKTLLITDAVMCAGMPDGEYELGGQKILKNGLKCTIKNTNTISGSVASMLDVIKTTIQSTSYNLADVLVMATLNVAQYHNLENKGIIKAGMDADLICFDKDLKIKKVFIQGILAYQN